MACTFQGRTVAFAIACLALFPIHSQAKTGHSHQELCHGFLPKNNLQIPEGMFLNQGVSRQNFDKVLTMIEKVYTPVVTQHGGRFKVNRLWTTNEVNASAERSGSQWIINMYGGLARHPGMTEEGFALVACHELGHHIGYQPTYSGDWASNEGQSDYFSTLKCMRFMYENEDNETWAQTADVDPVAVARCTQQFANRLDQLLCFRSAAGAQSIAAVFQDLDQSPTRASFSTPDPKVVRRTSDAHPETQCRIDTLFNGATCTVDKSVELGRTGWKTGACVNGVDQFGWRPLCWFKPI